VLPENVTVVVPTYNERNNLPHLAASVLLHGYRLLIVDDGSPDGTGLIADGLAQGDARVLVLHRREKQGLGPAYCAGFDVALAQGAEVVVEMDADFSHNPTDLPRLVAEIERGADVVIGSRYVPGGSTPDWPLFRRFISRGGNLYARLMLGTPVHDATAGFRAFRAEVLSKLPYRQAEASGYGFQVEMAWRAVQMGMNVVEIPITFRDRTVGVSKMSRDIVIEAMRLITLWGFQRFVSRLPWSSARRGQA
jgi:dolichol-phosphate mannosyltransferase